VTGEGDLADYDDEVGYGGAVASDNYGCCWHRPTLTGDWLGHRSCLEERGITFRGRVTQFAFGVDGGVDRPVLAPLAQGDTFEYTGNAQYDFIFDTEKFGGLPYGQLIVTAEQAPWGRFGNVSFDSGAVAPPILNSIIAPVRDREGVPYLTRFLYIQPLSEQFVVAVGKDRILPEHDDDIFAGGDGVEQFTNVALVDNPALLLSMPFSTFTAAALMPQQWGMITVFAVDPQDRSTEAFSRLGDLFSQGVILGGEVNVHTNFFCLPGQHRVGGLWKHTDLPDLRLTPPIPSYPYPPARSGLATIGDSCTLFYNFDQYLRIFSDEPRRGWGVFGRMAISDGNPTPASYFLSAGIGGYSPWRCDRGDRFGVGWYYIKTPSAWGPIPRLLFDPQDATGVELFYNFQLTPWLNITPDIQYVRPTLSRLAGDSFIYGLRVNMKL
jgi:porin